ncbi:MAG TPA: hypothetical protein VMX16_02070 [Terriglobia bacterium]|nr:hypothetical protein [Terriglobia bacterium]
MSYTTVSNVAGMFPSFARGTPQQKPPDALIQQYIDDAAGDIDASLLRRFAETIQQNSSGSFSGFLSGLLVASNIWQPDTSYGPAVLALDSNGNPQLAFVAGTSGTTVPTWSTVSGGYTTDGSVTWQNVSNDASRILEKINRYGAAAQLGATLATFGMAGGRDLAQSLEVEYEGLVEALNARDKSGRPLDSGLYDYLFDPLSRVQSPRPGFRGIAGGDQPKGQTPADLGMSNFFGKFDKKGT